MSMLVKFEPKLSRVKCISFHSKRSLMLVSLYSGQIQMWDHRLCTLIEKFEEHEGPVRAVSFHTDQPIFVSGGDDTNLKVWNYNRQKCLFTLSGHLDYIRSAFFHSENPWIISSSDDHSIRIWNWQSRNCISLVSGHSHYVMCAQFHPTQPLIVSCSLDQSIRIWDFTGRYNGELGLKNKYYSPESKIDKGSKGLSSIDVLVPLDVVVKYTLDGHEQGVNWVCFHPKEPIILSSSDDKKIKLWRYNENSAFEIDTLRGHYQSISYCAFSLKGDTIITASEDKSLRIWDANKHTCISTFRKDTDRFWCLGVCPNSGLIAAGHDSGFIVFKLNREKPAFDIQNNQLLYLKDRFLKKFDLVSLKDSVVAELKSSVRTNPSHLFYNPIENMILCSHATNRDNSDGNIVEIFEVPEDLKASDSTSDPIKITTRSGVWVSRNRFVVVDKNGIMQVKNTKNQTLNSIDFGPVTMLFPGYGGVVLTQIGEKISMIDVKDTFVINTIICPKVRFIRWSSDNLYLAFISKRDITICNKKLEIIYSYSEAISVKSAVFVSDNSSILIYTTPCHMKYIILPSGDHGIVRTIDVVLYVFHVRDKLVYCLDRDIKPRVISVDNTEYLFKLAILERRYENVIEIIRASNLVGQALIAFVREKGIPEIALHFIKDNRSRFHLGLECSNLDISLEMAKILDREELWRKLASAAIKLGNIQIAEESLLRIKDFQLLSFLYIISGNIEKLDKLQKLTPDTNSKICSLIYLVDPCLLANTFSSINEHTLAYAVSKSYSLENSCTFESKIPPNLNPKFVPNNGRKIFNIPTSYRKLNGCWPRLNISRSIFDIMTEKKHENMHFEDNLRDTVLDKPDNIWNEEDPFSDKQQAKSISSENEDAWVVSDEEISIEDIPEEALQSSFDKIDRFPLFGSKFNPNNNLLLSVIKGSFDSSFRILTETFGVKDFMPLKNTFMNLFIFTKIFIPSVYPVKSIMSYPISDCSFMALSPITLSTICQSIQTGLSLTTSGKFVEALSSFTQSLYHCLFINLSSDKKELVELTSFVKTCREYMIGLTMELERRSIQNNPNRSCELAAYFTHCDLQSQHLILVLRIAMNLLFKAQNYKSASVLARRLLDLAPDPDKSAQARKIIAASDKYGNVNNIEINYDEYNPFDICCGSFTPIYRGDKRVVCGFCSSNYKPEYIHTICAICKIAQVGTQVPGFRLSSRQ